METTFHESPPLHTHSFVSFPLEPMHSPISASYFRCFLAADSDDASRRCVWNMAVLEDSVLVATVLAAYDTV